MIYILYIFIYIYIYIYIHIYIIVHSLLSRNCSLRCPFIRIELESHIPYFLMISSARRSQWSFLVKSEAKLYKSVQWSHHTSCLGRFRAEQNSEHTLTTALNNSPSSSHRSQSSFVSSVVIISRLSVTHSE